MSAFDQAFAILIGHEGGYGCEREDPGNWTGGTVGQGALKGTNWGISAASYPSLDIAALTEDEAKAIYQRDYWAPMQCEAMPPGLALLVFDAAVNNGLAAATGWLQTATGTPADGAFGPATRAALAASLASPGERAISVEFQARRMMFMASLPTWRSFGLGWARRLAELPFQAVGITAD